ncbi:MAG: 16S rRNA (cytosine(1402)-N(4))-methyltransferase RsmH [Candidatus Saccharimonadales bacterium]
MSTKEHPPQHVPVLLEATLDTLQPIQGENYLDLTAGYGGHARRFLEQTKNYEASVLVDRDSFAIAELGEFTEKGVTLLHTDFVSAARSLVEAGKQFDIVLVDLGVSSPQLDKSERGFSFTHDGPLDMRMDRRQETSAETLVNTASKDELIHIIRTYGEEPTGFASRIAQAIIENRPFTNTGALAELVKSAYVGKWKKIHPATRTFQALRIAVNQELRQVEELLPLIPKLLKPGGRVGIISFHSLEDRLVKQYFNEQKNAGYEAELQLLTKKPLAGDIYDVHNPRSRSAKLRAAVKK